MPVLAASRTGSAQGVSAAASTRVRISVGFGIRSLDRLTRGGLTPSAGLVVSNVHRTACPSELFTTKWAFTTDAGAAPWRASRRGPPVGDGGGASPGGPSQSAGRRARARATRTDPTTPVDARPHVAEPPPQVGAEILGAGPGHRSPVDATQELSKRLLGVATRPPDGPADPDAAPGVVGARRGLECPGSRCALADMAAAHREPPSRKSHSRSM
jgi:hypothetical protein